MPVRVRLALHTQDSLPPRHRLVHYFSRLKEPVRQLDIDYLEDEIPNLTQGFLVCEDFGTRGLEGDPLLHRDPISTSSRQDFYWFWRNIGRSGKSGDDLGRWGLGKTVYRAASQIGCMLGLTVRQSDSKRMLMGQAVLRIHEQNGVEYFPEGYWCAGQEPVTEVPKPIDDKTEIDQFIADWKLTRGEGEPGLSVVSPYVVPELNVHKLLQAICVHFFLPIMRGELIVEIEGPSLPHCLIDTYGLHERCQSLNWDGPKRTKRHQPPPLEYVKKCLARQASAIQTSILGKDKSPCFDDSTFSQSELDNLRDAFTNNSLIAIKARIHLPRHQGSGETGELFVFLQKTTADDTCDTYFIREGMTITKLNSRARTKGIRALVLVEKGPLASLLGDSEGPAHEDWDTSEERPSRLWKKWKGRVTFCRRIVDELVEHLTPRQTTADFELLSDIFSIDDTLANHKSRFPSFGKDSPQEFQAIPTKPKWYRLEGRQRGFRVAHNQTEPIPRDAKLRVSVAYDLSTGDPLKKWTPFDFDFATPSSLRLVGEFVAARRIHGNVLILTISQPGFYLTVDGFDEHRDLFVRIDEQCDNGELEETD